MRALRPLHRWARPLGVTVRARPTSGFRAELLDTKKRLAAPDRWYPYDSISNLWHIDRLLKADNRDLHALTGGQPIADVGAADGDLVERLIND